MIIHVYNPHMYPRIVSRIFFSNTHTHHGCNGMAKWVIIMIYVYSMTMSWDVMGILTGITMGYPLVV